MKLSSARIDYIAKVHAIWKFDEVWGAAWGGAPMLFVVFLQINLVYLRFFL